jgi:hypothetical protein
MALHAGTTSLGRVYICLKVFAEMGLIRLKESGSLLDIYIPRFDDKVNLGESKILERLRR